MAPSSFKFPPGHRQRIEKFVKEVTKNWKQLQATRKRDIEPHRKSKRMKLDVDTSSSGSRELSPCDPVNMMGDIRRQISKWQRSQKSIKLAELKEHEQFEVKVCVKEDKPQVASETHRKPLTAAVILAAN
jgi:hypothetical protein